LIEWAFHCDHNEPAEQYFPLLSEGSEHLDYFDGATGDVLKITRVGLFGAYYELIDGRIHEFKCTPAEYLIRMRLLEMQFGFSQIPLGMTREGQVVSRQKFIAGDPPTQQAVDSFLEVAGLIPVNQSCWLWKGVMRDGFEPWVGAARADNFVNTAEGIIPIDLRMWQVIDPERLR
jgi:hypothetical protein